MMNKWIGSWLGMIFGIFVLFVACSRSQTESKDSPEEDGRKAAELFCKSVELGRKATTGDLSLLEESAKAAQEANETYMELWEKHASSDESERFLHAYNEGVARCP